MASGFPWLPACHWQRRERHGRIEYRVEVVDPSEVPPYIVRASSTWSEEPRTALANLVMVVDWFTEEREHNESARARVAGSGS